MGITIIHNTSVKLIRSPVNLVIITNLVLVMNLPCKPLACEIQACLIKNNYQVSRCMKEITTLIECCEKYKYIKQPCCEGWDNYRYKHEDKKES
uniref:Cx9C motif-containing protein 4 n=1 Tax=Trichobilharzia regenti TaxID=157069 RepID=A0AA85JMB5_TRIRE|nr:unnamed protein product [Trichobilharzia regenti]